MGAGPGGGRGPPACKAARCGAPAGRFGGRPPPHRTKRPRTSTERHAAGSGGSWRPRAARRTTPEGPTPIRPPPPLDAPRRPLRGLCRLRGHPPRRHRRRDCSLDRGLARQNCQDAEICQVSRYRTCFRENAARPVFRTAPAGPYHVGGVSQGKKRGEERERGEMGGSSGRQRPPPFRQSASARARVASGGRKAAGRPRRRAASFAGARACRCCRWPRRRLPPARPGRSIASRSPSTVA